MTNSREAVFNNMILAIRYISIIYTRIFEKLINVKKKNHVFRNYFFITHIRLLACLTRLKTVQVFSKKKKSVIIQKKKKKLSQIIINNRVSNIKTTVVSNEIRILFSD